MTKKDNLARRMTGGNLDHARQIKHLTPDQVERFLLAADTHESPAWGGLRYDSVKYGALFRVMLAYGLRRSEAAMQLISDLDMKEGTIWIPRLKDGQPKRYPLLMHLKPYLKEWLARRARLWKPTREFEGYEPLWTTGTGQRAHTDGLGDKAIAAAFVKIVAAAGIPPPYPGGKWSVHALRHTAAMNVLAKTGSFANVTDLLGHATINMARRYADMDDPQRGEYFDMLETI